MQLSAEILPSDSQKNSSALIGDDEIMDIYKTMKEKNLSAHDFFNDSEL